MEVTTRHHAAPGSTLRDHAGRTTREPDVQPPVFAERGLRVARVAGTLALASRSTSPTLRQLDVEITSRTNRQPSLGRREEREAQGGARRRARHPGTPEPQPLRRPAHLRCPARGLRVLGAVRGGRAHGVPEDDHPDADTLFRRDVQQEHHPVFQDASVWISERSLLIERYDLNRGITDFFEEPIESRALPEDLKSRSS